jgi:hypothetical protein
VNHLVTRHVSRILHCPYEGGHKVFCGEQLTLKISHPSDCVGIFDSPGGLLWHAQAVHHPNDQLKGNPAPFRPVIPKNLPPTPEQIPSFRHEPRRVDPASISSERHAHLGPWVSS